MVRIRLRRVGGKSQPSFRIVAADKESPRDGRFIEILGFYNPRTEPATIELKEDRIYDWMSKGAQPSDSAMQIFQTAGLVDRYERFKSGEKVEKLLGEAEEAAKARNVNPKTRHPAPVGKPKKKAKKEEKPEAKAPKAEAEQEEVKTEEAAEEKKETKTEAKKEAKAEAKVEEKIEAAEEAKAEDKKKDEVKGEAEQGEAKAEEKASKEKKSEETKEKEGKK